MRTPSMAEFRAFAEGRPSLGAVLREARERKRMTMREAAEKCGVTAPYWCDLEHDRRAPSPEMLTKLAALLDTSPALLRQTIRRVSRDLNLWLDKHPEVVAWLREVAR